MNKKNLLYILGAIVVLVIILIVFTKIDKKERLIIQIEDISLSFHTIGKDNFPIV